MKYVKFLLAIAVAMVAHWFLFFEQQAVWKVFVMLLILGVYLYGIISISRHIAHLMIALKENDYRLIIDRVSYANRKRTANSTKVLRIRSSDLFSDKDAPKTQDDIRLDKRLKARRNLLYILSITLSVGIASAYFMYLDRWKKHEIETHYVEQLVVVKSIWHRKARYVEFEYVYNNITYEDRTQNRWLNVGDTLKIAFSSRNPRIMEVKSYP